jgi:hypothetical protein
MSTTPLFLRLADQLVPIRLLGTIDLSPLRVFLDGNELPTSLAEAIVAALAPYTVDVVPVNVQQSGPYVDVPYAEALTAQDEPETPEPSYTPPPPPVAPKRALAPQTPIYAPGKPRLDLLAVRNRLLKS